MSNLAPSSNVSKFVKGDDVYVAVPGCGDDWSLSGDIIGFEMVEGRRPTPAFSGPGPAVECAVFAGASGGTWRHPTTNCTHRR